jgi:hypothetical protein
VFPWSGWLSAASSIIAFALFARSYVTGLTLHTLVALTQGGTYTTAIMAGDGVRRWLSGAASRAELRRGLRDCGGRWWGGAGRRGDAGAGKVGEDGPPGEGSLPDGDDAQAATTARVRLAKTPSGHGALGPFCHWAILPLTSLHAKAHGRRTVRTVRSSWGGSDAPVPGLGPPVDALGDHADGRRGRLCLSRFLPLVLLAGVIGPPPPSRRNFSARIPARALREIKCSLCAKLQEVRPVVDPLERGRLWNGPGSAVVGCARKQLGSSAWSKAVLQSTRLMIPLYLQPLHRPQHISRPPPSSPS